MTRPLEFDDLYRIPVAADARISPDGGQVAYVVGRADRETDRTATSIWLVTIDSGEARQLTAGPSDSSPRWSPSGDRLAFLSGREGGPPQLFVLDLTGGDPRARTALSLGAGAPVWSPDGRSLAFAAAAVLAEVGPDDPVVIDRLGFKADGAGMLGQMRTHLFMVDADGDDPPVQLTWGDWTAATPVWSPDGKSLAFTGARGADRDIDPRSGVYCISVAGGPPRPLTPESVQMGNPLFLSEDQVLCAGHLTLEPGHARLWTVPVDGGTPAALVSDFDRNVMMGAPGYPGGDPVVVPGGILFCARDRGCTHIYTATVDGSARKLIGGESRTVAGMTAAAGKVAFVAATPSSPGEVFVADENGGDERQLTDLCGSALGDVSLVAATSREFSAPDGTSVQGWVLRDPEAATPAPTLLDIHGGPHNAWAPVFDLYHLYHQTLAAAGWTIVYINPRGSDGYGEAFFQDVVRGWGLSDESDFHAALDELVAEGVADPSRLAVTGYSYGGFMTCWLTSTGDRFGAAVAGGSVVNLESEFGTSDMGWYLGVHEIGGLPTDEGDAYDRMSPIALAARASTPTLILHGEADQRCPVSQAEEWFAALRARRVPCQLVRYPGASHLFIISGRPSHRIDYARRLSDWVQAYTSGPVVARPLAGRLAGYQSRLDALAVRYRVPGAQLAVLDGDEIVSLATGVVDRDSAGPVTTETRFQIGSITKLFTATLMMQLVDRGLIDLDAPVTTYLPEFRTLSGSDAITIRHLLTHTNGIPGDRFVDTGPGEDAIARYVDGLAEVELVHPVGAMFSYSNAAFVVAGRVIEVVTGLTYDAALRSAIVDPLGLSLRTVTDEIILGSHALGHTGTGVAPVFALARGMTPAGSTPAATARDLVTFARMHLEDGAGVLSPASVKAMQERQVSLPPGTLLDGEGIAWGLSEWDGELVIGHNGGTLGQYSFLTVLPDRRLAIALLTNGPTGPRLAVDVNRDLFTELAGVTPRRPPEPPAEPVTLDLSVYTGEYVHAGARTTVFVEDGVLTARIESLLDVPGVPPAPPVTVPLTALDRQTFLVADEATLCFLEFDSSGRPAYLFNGRVAPRVG